MMRDLELTGFSKRTILLLLASRIWNRAVREAGWGEIAVFCVDDDVPGTCETDQVILCDGLQR